MFKFYKNSLPKRELINASIRSLLILIFSVCSLQSIAATDLIKLMSYNLLNYPGTAPNDTATKNPHFRKIISSVNPDILVVSELTSSFGDNSLLNNVLNVNGALYSKSNFIDGPDTDNNIYFKSGKFSFVSNIPIITALRHISEFTLIHTASGDTLRVYSVHLKASMGSANEILRGAEVDSLRKRTNALPLGSKFIVCGDFNIYKSSEVAYTKLLSVTAGKDGELYDPVNLVGTWNSPSYAIYHTQSTRGVLQFGGGATGGLDDRFDMILYSDAIRTGSKLKYVTNSLVAYGNDGTLYDDSINVSTNLAVPADVANSLYNASDHIPVLSTFEYNYNLPVSNIDMALSAFINPTILPCNNSAKQLLVSVMNQASSTINFATSPLNVFIKYTLPNLSVATISKIINTGVLSAGASMNVEVDPSFNMNNSGNYIFRCYLNVASDINLLNDSLSNVVINVPTGFQASISPNNSQIQFCSGSPVTLTASLGSSYLWSNGASSQAITTSVPGVYSVTVTLSNGCSSTSQAVTLVQITSNASSTVFIETMGDVLASPVSISSRESSNGFSNPLLTMTGNADVRTTAVSSGYTGVSGASNVYFSPTGDKFFEISGINTLNLSGLELSFGIWKSSNLSNGSDFLIQASSDGINYTNLTFSILTASSTWVLRTANGNIPSCANLRLRFTSTGIISQFRIDDIKLTATSIPVISSNGGFSFCSGDSITLTSTISPNYLWSTGETTKSIIVKNAGIYTVSANCATSLPFNVATQNCNLTLNLAVFLQGFYDINTHEMSSVLFNSGISNVPTACDTIEVSLFDNSLFPVNKLTTKVVLNTDGTTSIDVPWTLLGQLYYIVIKHRNSIETWSKSPILLVGTNASCDFTN